MFLCILLLTQKIENKMLTEILMATIIQDVVFNRVDRGYYTRCGL